MDLVLVMAIGGWLAVALLIGIVIGKSAKMGDNMLRIPKAEVFLPDMEFADDVPHAVRQQQKESEDPKWSEETVDRGVIDLMRLYRDQGKGISAKEAKEQVELMLNSQTGEM